MLRITVQLTEHEILLPAGVYAGALGVTWSILWLFLIADSPAKHPRIEPQEREYIEKSQGLLAAMVQ